MQPQCSPQCHLSALHKRCTVVRMREGQYPLSVQRERLSALLRTNLGVREVQGVNQGVDEGVRGVQGKVSHGASLGGPSRDA